MHPWRTFRACSFRPPADPVSGVQNGDDHDEDRGFLGVVPSLRTCSVYPDLSRAVSNLRKLFILQPRDQDRSRRVSLLASSDWNH